LPKRKKTMKLGFGEVANNEEKSLLYWLCDYYDYKPIGQYL
jgi:hypothetical protein